MEKQLIIAEKPSVASDIAKALGGFERKSDSTGDWFENGTTVISSGIGHLLELQCPEADDPGFDLEKLPAMPARFELKPIEKTASKLRLLKKLIQRPDVSTVINACDAGREGELIFRYIYEHVGTRKPMKRMWMQSMTPASIREAFSKMKPGNQFDSLFEAAQSRSEADWLIGINGTRAVTQLHQRSTGKRDRETVGRVQTPTLAILVDRELAIHNFVAKPYFEVQGTFQSKDGTYTGKWYDSKFTADPTNPDAKPERIFDATLAAAIVQACSGVSPSAVKEETDDISNVAPRLFDLTTLQRECNNKFGFSAKQTLEIAQALYEKHKALSYPRTDACCLPEDYLGTVTSVLGSLGKAGLEFSKFADQAQGLVKPIKRIFDNTKISDHFAIIPTGTLPRDLSIQESRVFDLVCRRFIAAFFPPALYKQTVRNTIIAQHVFRSSGRVLVSSGWKQVYGMDASEKDDPPLARVAAGEIPDNIEIKKISLKTKPPARFTEATLLAAMEGAGKLVDDEDLRDAMAERGLGTPATRAGIIEKLLVDKDKNGKPIEPYSVRNKKELVPTEKGIQLIQFLRQNGLTILTSPATTGEWESAFAMIEKRKLTRDAFMSGIRDMTRKIVSRVQEKARALPPVQRSSSSKKAFNVDCPKCQAGLETNEKVISCKSCDFVLWRKVFDRELSDQEAEILISKRITPVLKGFVGKKSRKTFDAALSLNSEWKVEPVFEKNKELQA